VLQIVPISKFMPSLIWDSKSLPNIIPGNISTDSIVYPLGIGYPGDKPKNRLIYGDNLDIMAALLPEYEGRINLIYVDPPFFSNKKYKARLDRGKDSRRPQDWQLAQGYTDHWRNMDDYLDMLYPRLMLMHSLLAPTGTLYLHLDWHANAYARSTYIWTGTPTRMPACYLTKFSVPIACLMKLSGLTTALHLLKVLSIASTIQS